MMRRSQQTHDSVNARPREVSSRPMADGVIMNAPVRVATIDDAPGIAKVLVDGWQSTYSGILPAAFLDSFRYETHAAGTRQHLQDLPSSVGTLAPDCSSGQCNGDSNSASLLLPCGSSETTHTAVFTNTGALTSYQTREWTTLEGCRSPRLLTAGATSMHSDSGCSQHFVGRPGGRVIAKCGAIPD